MAALRLTRPRLGAGSTSGFTLIEVLIATLVMVVGIVGMITAFDSGRKLSLRSERRTAMAQRAQFELERLQSSPYAQLAMVSAPTHSTEAANPDYYVLQGSSHTYQYGQGTEEAEPLVIAAKGTECASTSETECGVAATSPSGRSCSAKIGACEWKAGKVSGLLYDFITWHTDTNCGTGCPSKENYKRLTVVATVSVPSGSPEPAAVRVSTLVTEAG